MRNDIRPEASIGSGAWSVIQRGICSRYPITITSRSREGAGGDLSGYDYEHEHEQEQEQGTGRGGADLKSELVVVFVRSDPEPSYYIAFA